MSRSATSLPFADLRSIATLRLLRLAQRCSTLWPSCQISPPDQWRCQAPSVLSTAMTSAPRSASVCIAIGPSRKWLKLTTRMPCNRSSMRPSAFLAAGEALIRPPEHATGLDFGDVAWPREWLRRGLAGSALAPNLGKEGVEPAGHEQGKEGQGLGPGIDPLVPAVVADENRRARRHRMVLAVDVEKALAGNDIGGLVVLIVGVLANETTRSDRLHAQRIFV